MTETLKVYKTIQEVRELCKYLEDKDFVAVDTETTGVEKDSKIIGISASAEIGVGFYVITAYWDTNLCKLIELETTQAIPKLLQVLKDKRLIMHNAVFDCWMLNNNFNIDLMPSVHTDTMVLGHLLDENRSNGLKELAVTLYGESSAKEQAEMKASVTKNGGLLTKKQYELYKADADLIGRYGAKDTVLTLKLFYQFVPELYDQGLDKFFYEDESMPLLKGPTYDLNTTGLKVDIQAIKQLQTELEASIMESKAYVYKEIEPHVKQKYPGTSKKNTFNIGASQQMSWLMFGVLGNEFHTLTQSGKDLCKKLGIKIPYAPAAKRQFIKHILENQQTIIEPGKVSLKTGKAGKPKLIGEPWKYIACTKETLARFAKKYKWVEVLLRHHKDLKLLSTYVLGIQERMKYGIIRPNFLQIGTTSGRYSSKNPNFQNLPRDDKRVKKCIISRPGNVFVGADYSQLEPRVFASVSQDPDLMSCFEKGEDFYSVVGVPIFETTGVSTYKDDENSFAKKHPDKRNIAKQFALATPYGTGAFQQAQKLGLPQEECQYIIDRYFEAYPKVELMMLESHEQAKTNGVVYNLYGRPRRIPEAKSINKIYGKKPHGDLPSEARHLLNLSMNFRVQGTASSIVNRAAIALWNSLRLANIDAKIVLQVHDEIVVECKESDAEDVAILLQYAMETCVTLPGVKLVAEPKIAKNLGDLK